MGEWGIFRHPVCYASRLYRFIWYNISIILEYFGGNGGDIGRVGNFYTPGMLRESVIQIYMV